MKKIAIIFLLIGLVWLIPALASWSDVEVKDLKLNYNGVVDPIKLYLPQGEPPFPGVVFGAGAGADVALYRQWGEAFAKEGFVCLIRSSTSGRQNEEPWIDSRDDTINAIKYLKNHKKVDPDKIIVAGHSGNGNVAYWVGYKIPEQINGVAVIAGRHPPEKNHTLQTNLFLATGQNDRLVPPKKILEVAKILTGKNSTSGNFSQNDKITIYTAPTSNHLTEVWDNSLIKQTVNWSSQAVGNQYKGNYSLEKVSLPLILLKLVAGMFFLIGVIILLQQYINSILKLVLSTLLYFGIFFGVWSTTVSNNLFDSGPFEYKWLEYLILVVVIIICWLITFYFIKRDTILTDIAFILLSIIIFILISSFIVYLPPFSYGGAIIIFKALIVFILLATFSLIFHKLQIPLNQRLIYYSLTLIWLLAVVIPVK